VPGTLKIWRNVAIGATAMALVLAFMTVWSLARASKTLAATRATTARHPCRRRFSHLGESLVGRRFRVSRTSRAEAGREDVSLARADEASWQQRSDNDVILFGPFTIDGFDDARAAGANHGS
jgi:hypothetical protein